jgi:hypothetical protein
LARLRTSCYVIGLLPAVSSEKIREKLMLASDDITLEKALVIATNVKCLAFESKHIAGSACENDGEIRQVSGRSHRRNGSASRGSGRACFASGKSGHVKNDASCPAFGHQCNACHGVGHFALCCKQKQGAAKPGHKSAGTQAISQFFREGWGHTCSSWCSGQVVR